MENRLLSLFFGFIVAAAFMMVPFPALFGHELASIIKIVSAIIALILGILILIEAFRNIKIKI
jgi:VIT1/CCC1 family predicted Fe2+/Mn2+ transporter